MHISFFREQQRELLVDLFAKIQDIRINCIVMDLQDKYGIDRDEGERKEFSSSSSRILSPSNFEARRDAPPAERKGSFVNGTGVSTKKSTMETLTRSPAFKSLSSSMNFLSLNDLFDLIRKERSDYLGTNRCRTLECIDDHWY